MMGKNKDTFPTTIKSRGKWYRYDRYTKRGMKGKESLKKIGEFGKKTGAIKGYRIIQGKPKKYYKGTYGLYIR